MRSKTQAIFTKAIPKKPEKNHTYLTATDRIDSNFTFVVAVEDYDEETDTITCAHPNGNTYPYFSYELEYLAHVEVKELSDKEFLEVNSYLR